MTLLRWLTFVLGSQTVIFTVLLFRIYFFLLALVFVLQWLTLHWGILIMLLSQFPLTFHHIYNAMPLFIALLMTILVLIGMGFVIIWEMFHEWLSLNSVLLLLLVNFLSRSGCNSYIYPSSKVSGQASLISVVFSCLWCCHRNHFFGLFEKDKSSESKLKFRLAIKSVLEAAKLAYANKTKESITSQQLGSGDFLTNCQ